MKKRDIEFLKNKIKHLKKTQLIPDHKREELMQQWDYWRKQIRDGNVGSYPRDWFESVLDWCESEYQNRTVTIRTNELPKWKPSVIIGRKRRW